MNDAKAALWRDPHPLVLASTSPTRRALLESAALPFAARAPAVDERALEMEMARRGASPEDISLALAGAKAASVAVEQRHSIVIGSDQVLALEERRFNKPASRTELAEQIAALAGRTHRLHSAVAMMRGDDVLAAFVASASLTMRALSPSEIELYCDLAGDGALESVGGYRLEGVGVHLFTAVEGEHSTVLGLPLSPLLAHLRALGALAF
ncbi:MAG: septum formation inhibitor Maf [Salinarimonadaceae bacterium]|nr:MAG: septum formation inhibitor Maf [Salinarimonadaceae bacterium]